MKEKDAMSLRKEGKKILTRAENLVKKLAIKCQAMLCEMVGHAGADVIVQQAKKCRADLIVLGTHGRRSITRLVMGSDADGVLRATRVPVLRVRDPSAVQPHVGRGKKS
jgi:nucleotide-binding universal stress UspA family protein